ncbi:hypothetical protein PTW32_00790 [Dechloromonas agitata]|jgi:hypothetical protein|uniref:hypothetical protein n=1 Tax=Dechloromonas agitata TaxID=73030 RepID=UPI00237EC941|nr:hypothetical protein [Dechloromonas agitata]MDE1543936.1 hypothetical protein [Dechloromonas agitata]
MRELTNILWPRPQELSAIELERFRQEDLELDAQIKSLPDVDEKQLAVYLEAVRRIADEEGKRKAGAETRATTFIAAVATLIPLMTWALGNTDRSICSGEWGCFTWTAVFTLAVVYFVTGAYWSLKTLAVANFHVIGVEDIVLICEKKKDIVRELIRQTLLQARKNRDTINEKLTFIKIAQRRFFNGLAVLGLLLMFDPLSRFGTLTFLASKLEVSATPSVVGPSSCVPVNLLMPFKLGPPKNSKSQMTKSN